MSEPRSVVVVALIAVCMDYAYRIDQQDSAALAWSMAANR